MWYIISICQHGQIGRYVVNNRQLGMLCHVGAVTQQTLCMIYITTRLNAFACSCLFNATAVAAQCHSQQTNSESLARRHHEVHSV